MSVPPFPPPGPGDGPRPASGPPGEDKEEPQPDPVYDRLEDWIEEYFLPMFCRPLGGALRWCPLWNLHPEAVTRLTACWRSWESLRTEPATGISEWLRDHLDYHLSVLTDQRGPFYQCSAEGGHLEPKAFPCDPRSLIAPPEAS